MISIRSILIGLLVLLAFFLSGWSIFISGITKKIPEAVASNKPDGYIEDAVAIVMNEEGKPRILVETPQLLHYAENDRSELNNPHVVIYRASSEPWHIKAKHAYTLQGIREITFWDNVIIEHQADSTNPLTTMKTATLTIIPDDQIAKTSEAVTVTQPNTRIDAVGMLANWKEGTIKLLSQAREEYVPKS